MFGGVNLWEKVVNVHHTSQTQVTVWPQKLQVECAEFVRRSRGVRSCLSGSAGRLVRAGA